ncbi:hypothetical protein PYW08_004060 [Mythimna loreyi]|uniref:Uncharacterized protein n=1 Tax=Mythimna loreyi TaxID=667449 RepID=A0ACC2QVH2_9NEOP|nr:hypothetical protein PYW08_004060 [Mythimna loreyi]
MRSLIWICLVVATWSSAFALYYERTKQIFRPPVRLGNDSYFGYSITYNPNSKKLVISAPRTDNIGDVYDCSIDKNSCNVIDRSIITRGPELQNYTHEYWFGATVKAGPDFVIMCAPRHTEHTPRYNGFVTRGTCYSHTNSGLTKRQPISEEQRVQDSHSTMEATMDSFGWSIDVASDDSVIVGGPGMYHGRAMIYTQLSRVPDFIRYDSKIPQFNFGYAVATGTFINDKLSYAISSTYRSGEILFYKKYNTYQKKLKSNFDTVGTMFGAVLCAAKMYGSRSDLLVGAPAYGQKDKYAYNLGAVHVYLAKIPSHEPTFNRLIVGEVSGSMFGSAIINVGDLNNDKKDEIAIGAPFENGGQGVVYLYSGADLIISEKTVKTIKPLQKIKPEAPYGLSFGMSLTPLLDYDENGCKEIAIGSPYTDTVVLLRCMASVLVNTTAKFRMEDFENRTASGKTDFKFDVCLTLIYPTLPKKITARIKTTVEMIHENAKLAKPDSTGRFVFETSLDERQLDYCKTVPFILPPNGKYDTEIRYIISSELLDDPRTLSNFDASRVILSDRSVLKIQNSLWVAECSGKLVCKPNLKFTPYFSFKNDVTPYIIGSTDKETMSVTVSNSGDVAYASCVKIHIVGANVHQPGNCVFEATDSGDRLKCETQKPLWSGEETNTGLIELETNHLTNLDTSINITIFLHNRCNEAATEYRTITIPLKADPSGITAKGETDIGDVVDMTEEDIKNNGKYFRHTYKIENHGHTNWEDLDVLVTLELYPFINYINNDNTSVIVFSDKTNFPCTEQSATDTTNTYLCKVKSLKKKDYDAQIVIPIYVLPNTLDGHLTKDQNMTITSSIKMTITKDTIVKNSVTTTLMLQEAPVPVQTIIIAVVVGLCILIIIAVVLYRIGFLRRKRKEELEKLRKSVKRQTILRRSTMPNNSQSSEDRRQILEEMKEEDEHDQAQKQTRPI